MKNASVALVDMHDNNLKMEIVSIQDLQIWKDALIEALKIWNNYDADMEEYIDTHISDDIDIAKEQFFDCDLLFEVKEL